MYGLSSTSPLSQAVEVLCQTHFATHPDGFSGMEEPLLRILEGAIGSDQGRGSVSGVSGASGVLNLSALELWQAIHRTVGEFWPGKGSLRMAKMPLIARLELWTMQVAGTPDEPHLLEMCVFWAQQVRDLMNPPKRVPIRGGKCSACSQQVVASRNLDGETVYGPCLLAHLSETPLRVECLACGAGWEGNLLALQLAN